MILLALIPLAFAALSILHVRLMIKDERARFEAHSERLRSLPHGR